MAFGGLGELAWHILPILTSFCLICIMQVVFNCAKKPSKKGNRRSADKGVQMNPLEFVMRFGKEQGTQLGRHQKSFEQLKTRQGRTMPVGMNVLQMHMYGELFKLLDEDTDIFNEIPPDLHPYCRLLRQVSLFYLRPEMLEIGCGHIDQDAEIRKCEKFDKKKYLELLDIIEKAVKGNKKKEEAVKILREAWLKKHGLGQAELAIVYNELGADVKNKTKLDKEALEKLLQLLIQNEIITKEDGKMLTATAKRLTDDHGSRGEGDKLQMNHLLMLMEPEMQLDQGRIASRRKIGDGTRTLKVTTREKSKFEVPVGANVTQMYLSGELFKLLEDDQDLYKKVPEDMRELLKLLRLITEFYMRKNIFDKEGGKIDQEIETMNAKNFDKVQFVNLLQKLEPTVKGDKKKEHAFEIVKESWFAKRGLTEDELAFVFEELGKDVKDKVKLDKIALNHLLDLLVQNEIITKADQQAIFESATKVADKNAAQGTEQTVKISQLSAIIEPELEVNKGGIASRRQILQPKTQIIEFANAASSSSNKFFAAAPEDATNAIEFETWRNTKLSGDIARCMAPGAGAYDAEQHMNLVEKWEQPAAQQLLVEIAESFLNARGFVVTRGSVKYPNSKESLQSTALSTAKEKSVTSVLPNKSSSTLASSSKVTMTEVGADKEKYTKILGILKKDKQFMKDPEKRKVVEMLQNAIDQDEGLGIADLEKVMNTISKDVIVPNDAVDNLIKRLVKSGAIKEEERAKIVAAIHKAIGRQRGITMRDLHQIVSKETRRGTQSTASTTSSRAFNTVRSNTPKTPKSQKSRSTRRSSTRNQRTSTEKYI